MDGTELLKKICSVQKHVSGEWDLNHLKSRLIEMLLTLKDNAVIFVYFRDEKPNSIFAGYVSLDWACNKKILNEVVWVTVGKARFDGIKVLQAAENFILENSIDSMNCSYMCHGGDPRLQLFLTTNGFQLDTLSFVKNYK